MHIIIKLSLVNVVSRVGEADLVWIGDRARGRSAGQTLVLSGSYLGVYVQHIIDTHNFFLKTSL
jgi:hypothetical protein